MGTATWYFMWVWGYVAEINAKRIRERYLRAILRQDIAFFDTTGAGEVATRIQTDTRELLPLPCP
jgi:ATP-binding cassette subfamily B (MDR/TAP) protein 1